MRPLPHVWDFRIKDTVGSMENELFKAICCLSEAKQGTYSAKRVLGSPEPEGYAPVAVAEALLIKGWRFLVTTHTVRHTA